MDAFNLWLPLIAVGILAAIAIGAFFADKKIAAVWFGFACVVCLVFLLALQADYSIREASKTEPLSPEAAALRVLVAAQTKSQRAWISIRPQLFGDIKAGSPIGIDLIFENVGNEPAIGVNHRGSVMTLNAPTQIGYAPELWTPQFAEVIRLEADLANPLPGKTTIFPGKTVAIRTVWTQPEAVRELISKKKILLIYGAAGYLALGEPHFTWYCFYLFRDEGSQWQLGSAPIGNDAN